MQPFSSQKIVTFRNKPWASAVAKQDKPSISVRAFYMGVSSGPGAPLRIQLSANGRGRQQMTACVAELLLSRHPGSLCMFLATPSSHTGSSGLPFAQYHCLNRGLPPSSLLCFPGLNVNVVAGFLGSCGRQQCPGTSETAK